MSKEVRNNLNYAESSKQFQTFPKLPNSQNYFQKRIVKTVNIIENCNKISSISSKGGGDFAGGIFHCGKFRISNVCEIFRSIFRPLCEINPVRNLATGAKFSHWGFAGFAGGMLCVSHCLPPPPSSVGFWVSLAAHPPLFPVSCPILHLALLSENDESRPNVPQSR